MDKAPAVLKKGVVAIFLACLVGTKADADAIKRRETDNLILDDDSRE
jgi:hypothetical protein